MRLVALTIIAVFVSTIYSSIDANTIKVPEDFATIQQAINASVDGDTILVAQGTYYENINFRGKNILLTSYYIFNEDVNYITNTIINGSQPVYTDTASCVLIVNGEDSTAVLQGFTLTGGTGTKWIDEHGAGTYIEGGGILTTLSSPTIRNNLIIDNEAINSPSGTISAGGGAIRCGDGSPRIVNNVIVYNKGMYGGGIVLNYCSNALIANNIIASNRVFQAVSGKPTFGGGGVWILETITGDNTPNIIENNSVISNSSNDIGGGIRIWSANVIIRNNIIWNNIQENDSQIHLLASKTTLIEYNDIENGFAGFGNIDLHPSFADSGFYLNDNSPCIDAGDPYTQYNDPEDIASPGKVLWPSKGTIRNDIGAYGGPLRSLFSNFSSAKFNIPYTDYDFGLNLPGETVIIELPVSNNGSAILKIDSTRIVINNTEITMQNSFPIILQPIQKEALVLTWTTQTQQILLDTILIYHNDPDLASPYKISLTGNSLPNALLIFDDLMQDFGDIDVNTPRIDTTFYIYNRGTASDSCYTSIIYQLVNPDSALELTPKQFEIEPHDSVGITFTIYPPRINRTGLNIYQPKIVIDSRFNIGQKHFEKRTKFRLVGTSGLEDKNRNLPDFNLLQNYPNPFNPNTTIKYSIPQSSVVVISIFDVLGNEIATIVNQEKPVGTHEVEFNGNGLPSGIYYYQLRTDDFLQTKKMILIK